MSLLSFADSAPQKIFLLRTCEKCAHAEWDRERERQPCQMSANFTRDRRCWWKESLFISTGLQLHACIRTDLIHYKIIAFLSATYQLSKFHCTELFHRLFHTLTIRSSSWKRRVNKRKTCRDYAHSDCFLASDHVINNTKPIPYSGIFAILFCNFNQKW